MSPWEVAAAAVNRAFRDPEPIVYFRNGVALPQPIAVVRSDTRAPSFDGSNSSLRRISYEITFADLPDRPVKKIDSFTHRGRRWRIENVDDLDEVRAWSVTVGDDGPAA